MGSNKQFQFLFVGHSKYIATHLHEFVHTHAHAIFSNKNSAVQPLFEFSTVTSQRAALQQVRAKSPQVILLETGNGNGDRLKFATALRQRQPAARLIEVASEPKKSSQLFDMLLKVPIETRQAIEVLQRSVRPSHSHLVQFASFTLDTANDLLIRPDGERSLRPMESRLLGYLLENRNSLVKRIDIMREVWGTDFLDDTRTLDVHIRQLRKQIEVNPSRPELLITERGLGYILKV